MDGVGRGQDWQQRVAFGPTRGLPRRRQSIRIRRRADDLESDSPCSRPASYGGRQTRGVEDPDQAWILGNSFATWNTRDPAPWHSMTWDRRGSRSATRFAPEPSELTTPERTTSWLDSTPCFGSPA